MIKKWIKRSVALICSLLFVVFASCAYVEKSLNFLFPKDSSYSSSSTQSSLSTDDASSSSENISSSDSNSSSSASSEDSSSSVECKHRYGGWETVVEATCKPGMKERVCKKCGETEQEEIPLIFTMHTFNSQTLCTTCGYQEFIESEEYVIETEIIEWGVDVYNAYYWMSTDGSYGLKIMFQEQNGKYMICGYLGKPVNVVLPSIFKGKTINVVRSAFGDGSRLGFSNCETLKNVIVTEGMQTIGTDAFKNCTSLEYVMLSDTITSVQGSYSAFDNCVNLKEITIPRGVTVLYRETFTGPSSLETICLETIYYRGTKEEWEKVGGFDDFEDVTICYYSETEPIEEGNYWHYINGRPVLW